MSPGLWFWLIRRAFWVLYNPLAWTYDWVSQVVSMGHWHEWQRTALAELRGKRVLDLAFGTGNMLLDLQAANYRPAGLDLSPSMVHIAQQRLRSSGCVVPLARGRAQQLPFVDASFDSVCCTFPAHFIVDPSTWNEIARILSPGGRVVIVAMALLATKGLWARFLEWIYRLTGQRGPLPNLEPQLAELGLAYRVAWKPMDRSRVLLIIAEKD